MTNYINELREMDTRLASQTNGKRRLGILAKNKEIYNLYDIARVPSNMLESVVVYTHGLYHRKEIRYLPLLTNITDLAKEIDEIIDRY